MNDKEFEMLYERSVRSDLSADTAEKYEEKIHEAIQDGSLPDLFRNSMNTIFEERENPAYQKLIHNSGVKIVYGDGYYHAAITLLAKGKTSNLKSRFEKSVEEYGKAFGYFLLALKSVCVYAKNSDKNVLDGISEIFKGGANRLTLIGNYKLFLYLVEKKYHEIKPTLIEISQNDPFTLTIMNEIEKNMGFEK